MHFPLSLLLYCIFSFAYGCTEELNFERDNLLETKNLETAGLYDDDDDSSIVLDRLLEQRLGQFMQNGELNMGNFMVKLTEMLKDSNLQSLYEEFTFHNGCSSDTRTCESEISDEDRVIEMPTSDVSGTCGALN